MTPPELPEDVSQWPSDPYRLLGVARDVDEPALKRAYAQLIRRYKPDHAPEAFRSIRDAYDAIRNRTASAWPFSFQVADGAGHQAAGEPAANDAPSRNLLLELDAAWRLAERGEYSDAYRELRRLAETAPDDEEIAVRLSWLLSLSPELQESVSAAAPLTPILRRVGLKGRAGELYLRLLERDRSEAISDRCGALLTRSRSHGRLIELARARWTAAAAECQWYLILTELKKLDDELVDDVRQWLLLHLTAMELAATSRSQPAQAVLTHCQSVFGDHEDQALTEPLAFDRAEELLAVAQDLQRYAEVAAEQRQFGGESSLSQLVELISPTDAANEFVRQRRLLNCLEEWLKNPGDALATLDAFQHDFPALAFSLLRLVREAGDPFAIREQKLDGQELRDRLELAMSDGRIRDIGSSFEYRTLRVEVLRFCLDEFAEVNDVADALVMLRPAAPSIHNSGAEPLRRDLGLQCIATASLAFWLESAE